MHRIEFSSIFQNALEKCSSSMLASSTTNQPEDLQSRQAIGQGEGVRGAGCMAHVCRVGARRTFAKHRLYSSTSTMNAQTALDQVREKTREPSNQDLSL